MKIIIKPYRNSITPWSAVRKIFFWKDEDDQLVDKLGDILAFGFKPTYIPATDPLSRMIGIRTIKKRTKLNSLIYKLNDFIPERKVKIRIDNYDTWNLDETLRPIIYKSLLKLKELKHGSPHIDNEDVPKGLRAVGKYDEDETVHERWAWALNEMIFAFDQRYYDALYEMRSKSPEELHLKKRLDNGRLLFAKYYNGLWS